MPVAVAIHDVRGWDKNVSARLCDLHCLGASAIPQWNIPGQYSECLTRNENTLIRGHFFV